MAGLVSYFDRTLYPGFTDNWDNWLLRETILRHLKPDDDLLDVGAGAGFVEATRFGGGQRPSAVRVHGIDPDPRVLENEYLDDARIGWAEDLPYQDNTFDLAFSCNVLEHLPDPHAVFREVQRVLKPGGVFICKTPNRHHYVPLLAQVTPHAFHQWYNELRGRAREDTFPTLYRANSPRAVRRIARDTGWNVETIDLVEGRPEYLRIHPLTYLAGWAYQRAVTHVPGLAMFRGVLIAVLRKPAAAAQGTVEPSTRAA